MKELEYNLHGLQAATASSSIIFGGRERRLCVADAMAAEMENFLYICTITRN